MLIFVANCIYIYRKSRPTSPASAVDTESDSGCTSTDSQRSRAGLYTMSLLCLFVALLLMLLRSAGAVVLVAMVDG